MSRLLSLALIAGLAYGGLYLYYGAAVEAAVEDALADMGLTALTVEDIDYAPTAPLGREATITADIVYQGAAASIDLTLHGHPLFSEEIRLELGGLQALRLTIGGGQ
ncbi:hypothetical protein [Halomonas koreensis]|uniref:DUF945 domain-containing protein n=1 Tax=Halomonas koreensis TaxID=245385 RepID=A0ABU1G473_9GAMM|nr:hypothetical protein [Halomonas koreensis]MDR5867481.1 hypothetical protein [Halomonas koreensis]